MSRPGGASSSSLSKDVELSSTELTCSGLPRYLCDETDAATEAEAEATSENDGPEVWCCCGAMPKSSEFWGELGAVLALSSDEPVLRGDEPDTALLLSPPCIIAMAMVTFMFTLPWLLLLLLLPMLCMFACMCMLMLPVGSSVLPSETARLTDVTVVGAPTCGTVVDEADDDGGCVIPRLSMDSCGSVGPAIWLPSAVAASQMAVCSSVGSMERGSMSDTLPNALCSASDAPLVPDVT
mmetsp:Transcript_22877/g.64793  ORF Transcript_22877/g.64793 Transcript_22877/m.64793 type:complete len:238 (+) Transcript_22877:2825-3538(+)